MRGLDDHYRTLLAEHQGRLDASAAQDEEEYELTPEDKAFMESYLSCVALGKEEDVIEFLRTLHDDDVFMTCHIYDSIEQAWLLWQDAIKFMKDKKK